MDNISKSNVRDTDPQATQAMKSIDETSEALPDIFRNPLILNLILEHLPNSKLLELSFVSKLWKKEARSVIKKRANVMALLKCDGVTGCGTVFEAFAANLETLSEALYSGMTIWFRPVGACEGTGAVELERIHESILAGMRGKLRRFSIRLNSPEICWNNARDCPNYLLLQLLLRDFMEDLEHLTLRIDKITETFIQQFLPHGPYPKLKVMKLGDYYTSNEETFGNSLVMLLSRAPNLQEMHTHGHVSLRRNLLEGREGVVHVLESFVDNPIRDIPEDIIPALRLKRVKFFVSTIPELQLDRFKEKAQSLLRTCCATTLKELQLDAVSAVLVMSYGIPLAHVKDLHIFFDYLEVELFEPRILNILSRFDFTYLFPNLKKVSFSWCSNLNTLLRHTMDAIIEQAGTPWTEPTPPQAGNIKYLYLDQGSFPTSAVQFFAHLFPAIEELEIDGLEEGCEIYDEDFPVGSAWELWPDLKWIHGVGKLGYQHPRSIFHVPAMFPE